MDSNYQYKGVKKDDIDKYYSEQQNQYNDNIKEKADIKPVNFQEEQLKTLNKIHKELKSYNADQVKLIKDINTANENIESITKVARYFLVCSIIAACVFLARGCFDFIIP